MRVLYLDCFSGIAGDMVVGALLDLGVPWVDVERELAKLPVGAEFHAHVSRAERNGVNGVRFEVHDAHHHPAEERGVSGHAHGHGHSHGHGHGHAPEHSHGHGHSHEHEDAHGHEHAHAHVHGRTYAEIRGMLEGSALGERVKARALGVFRRIAEAEAKVHGMPVDAVHFHEVGAIDSIVDIVAACVALELLGVDAVWASVPQEGCGFVDCAHGRFPIPATATVEILRGFAFEQTSEPHELITPTGAAIYAEWVSRVTPWSGLRVERLGYGLGRRSLHSRPNVLRAAVAQVAEGGVDDVVVIETNLDDLTPEMLADAQQRLLADGALDAHVVPCTMKKGRAGFVLSVLARPEDAERLAERMLQETTAFGVRMYRASRRVLTREWIEVATPHGSVRVKIGRLNGRGIQASPEFEDCRRAAESAGVPVREVIRAAMLAAAPHATRVP